VLHGQGPQPSKPEELDSAARGGFASLVPRESVQDSVPSDVPTYSRDEHDAPPETNQQRDWLSNMQLLIVCFLISGCCTVLTYFFPIIRNLPIFGTVAANTWLWTLNPSLAYVGQGVIMGTETTLHMTLGAFIGWGLLSPLAKFKGWAPGPVDDWEHGSKGWIVWVSLAIMLVDAVVSLGYAASRPILHLPVSQLLKFSNKRLQKAGRHIFGDSSPRYSLLESQDRNSLSYSGDMVDDVREAESDGDDITDGDGDIIDEDEDAPVDQRIGGKVVVIGLVASITLCIGTTHFVFGDLVPLYATILAVFLALILSIMGVRALGETDLNPVSGISKLAQLFFALIIPQSNTSSVLINLVAGAVVGTPPPLLLSHF
jgi:hypothetical protein